MGNRIYIFTAVSAFIFASVLTACGGGGGSNGTSNPPPVANADPGGIYTGTATSSGTSTNLVGIVTESGQAVILAANNEQFIGNLSVSGNNISATLTGYPPYGATFLNGSSMASFSVSATISQGVSISGTYSGGGDQGNLALTDNPTIYNRFVSLATLVGTWEGPTADGGTLTVTIQNNGSFFGQNTDGCTSNGTFVQPNPSFNVYAFSVTVGGAVNCNYSASGLATVVLDTSTNTNVIYYGAANGPVSITGLLDQQ